MRIALEHRTGLPGLIARFMNEELPASCGWAQVFGSVALFLFLIQALTGILLSLNFAPAAGEAHTSLRYIVSEVTGGKLIRGLHHWGASIMLITVVAHMVQVFLFGAYKKPREATWMAGVFLLLMTLAYSLTGYLLPWDNRAYWGTTVTTRIAAQAPVIGPYLLRVLGAENGLGVLTYARFYSMHVLILPPLTVLLIVFHIYLVRKHGITPAPGDEARPRVKFFPRQVFKDTIAIFAAFSVLFLMAAIAEVPLGKPADPTDVSYVPRPEWYFLFLFESLKFFEGPLEVFASVVLPGLAVGTLLVVPFIDRGRAKRVAERTAAFGVVLFGGFTWAALTFAAIASNPPESVSAMDTAAWNRMTPEALASAKPGAAPQTVIEGARLYVANHCETCHVVNGAGNAIGPGLNGVAARRSREWIERHFENPPALSPGSIMPPYKFSEADRDRITSYLLTLPGH